MKAIEALPTEAVYRLLNQWPVIEIHRLKKRLPGGAALFRDVERLFGNVIKL